MFIVCVFFSTVVGDINLGTNHNQPGNLISDIIQTPLATRKVFFQFAKSSMSMGSPHTTFRERVRLWSPFHKVFQPDWLLGDEADIP